MKLTDISIKRPVLAIVINFLILLIGIFAYTKLPVREYPDIETPVVSVTTTYIGASSETIESTITEPLEQAINGINGVRSIRSTSSFGVSTINIEFYTSRDLDDAANDVSNTVQSALGKIPLSADKPIISKSTANSFALMWLVLQGEKYTPEELSDIADRLVKTPLQILPGVGAIIIGGQRKYAMRIWLDPIKMAAKYVDANDIREALTKNNLQLPAGQVKGKTRQFNILANGLIDDPKIYENIVVKNENNIPVRIKDVGSVELGSANYDTIVRFNGRPVVSIGVIKQSRANELKVADEVKKAIPKIKEAIPKDIELKISVDNSRFIKASLNEIKASLWIAFMLVIFVTLIFLNSFQATIIATISIPISIIGSFAAMYFLNFSINVLTLLGLVLAIGLVIDDAIVVIENIYRRQENGEDTLTAALNGSQEIAFPVIATTVSLVAVFIPLSVLTGAVGRQFKEFALTVAVSVAISGFVALTIIPALCSIHLKLTKKKKDNFPLNINNFYMKSLQWSISHKNSIVFFLLLNIFLSGALFLVIPKTSVPVEDRGIIVSFIKAPQGSTLAYTFNAIKKAERCLAQIPEIECYFSAIGLSIGGPGNPSNGIIYARLKPWEKRNVKQQDLVKRLFPQFMQIPEALTFPINPPSLGLSSLTKDLELIIKGSSRLRELEKVSNRILDKIKQIPGLVNVDTDLLINTPQLNITFDHERIFDLGLTISDISKSIQILFSEGKINDFILRNKQYDVISSLYPLYKSNSSYLKKVYVLNKDKKLISLDGIINISPETAPAQINHFDLQRSVTISGNLVAGNALGNVLDSVKPILKESLPPGFSFTLAGISREFAEASFSIYFIFFIAIIFIYLILAALFESFIHPFTILLAVPLALLGALITLLISSQTLNLYSAIGIILLIGLVTKNSILIVEWANNARRNGLNLTDAVTEAAKIRFRPILMTSIAMILGNFPLVIAHGAGTESRQSMGFAILGGLIFSTIFTLIVIPVVYILIVKVAEHFNVKTTSDKN